MDAEEGRQEEGGRSLVALADAFLAQQQPSVLLADEGGKRVGQREDQQRDAEQQLVALGEPEQQQEARDVAELADALAPHRVEHLAHAGAQFPDHAQGEEAAGNRGPPAR